MNASLEKEAPFYSGSPINALSWKSSNEDDTDEIDGYLASATRDAVGVTVTTCPKYYYCGAAEGHNEELPQPKHSFNFREHGGNVTSVEWNPTLDKIASCDSTGTVIVWRNQNGRATMELVNNRNTAIASFRWSHSGQKVLIAYEDGFILVGTAVGRRLWARQLNIGSYVTHDVNRSDKVTVVSACWSPDDTRVIVGSSIGELVELDVTNGGMLISTTEVLPGIAIMGLEWAKSPIQNSQQQQQQQGHLTLYLANGKVVLMSSCGDQHATIIRTGLSDGRIAWSDKSCLLAVAGYRKSHGHTAVRFFKPGGQLMATIILPTKENVTAITWGHNDKRVFIGCGSYLFTVRISYEVPSLMSLSQQAVLNSIANRQDIMNTCLHLPIRLKQQLAQEFSPSLQGYTPRSTENLMEYVSKLPPAGQRLYCTMVPDQQESNLNTSNNNNTTNNNSNNNRQQNKPANNYTLYVEHLGGLVPILKATRKPTKLKPTFTISLPDKETRDSIYPKGSQLDEKVLPPTNTNNAKTTTTVIKKTKLNDNLDFISPRKRRKSAKHSPIKSPAAINTNIPVAEVTSSMISSKFRINGLAAGIPSNLGHVRIKTSFLHMQPREVQVSLPKSEDYDSGIETLSDYTTDEETDCTNGEIMMDLDSSYESKSSRPSSPLFVPVSSPKKRKLVSPGDICSKQGWAQKNAATTSTNTRNNLSPRSATSNSLPGTGNSDMLINSRTPIWNDQHMIYQLDFGGRVTCKSAKNFQLETNEHDQVLQFGKINNGSFTLDFQGPFTPIQAFATALANIF